MTGDTIYVRVPTDIKEKVNKFATANGKSQTDGIIELINRGLDLENTQKQLSEATAKVMIEQQSLQKKSTELEETKFRLLNALGQVNDAIRAKAQLERVLNTEVGKCGVCQTPVSLNWFAYQQCPQGHTKSIELYEEYKKSPGGREAIVAGLAMLGGIIIANEVLGGNSKSC